ncbi:MAG TPA: hypothetical protein VMI92_04445 [Steroidobacteraceae bacterium]|nr:hypothetical protein [Steroidobacteraceae bacterium]
MNGIWSLPQAAPILMRHLGAYAELAGQDFEAVRQQIRVRLISMLLMALGAFFAVLMICVAVIAAAWDTPQRMSAIYWLIGVFVALCIASGGYFMSVRRGQPPPFATVRREWALDREILARILAAHEPGHVPSHAPATGTPAAEHEPAG